MRISTWEIENASPTKKKSWAKAHRSMVAAELEKVEAAAKALGKDDLDDWEQHALTMAADIAKQNELEELETSMRELFKLAGMNYGVERSVYFSRKSAQAKLRNDE